MGKLRMIIHSKASSPPLKVLLVIPVLPLRLLATRPLCVYSGYLQK